MVDELRAVMEQYRLAFDAFDAEAVAEFYCAPCLLIESGRVALLASRADVLANMRALVEQYRRGGYGGAAIARGEMRSLGDGLALATVDWAVDFGGREARFTNSYQLVRDGAGWRIAVSTLHGPG